MRADPTKISTPDATALQGSSGVAEPALSVEAVSRTFHVSKRSVTALNDVSVTIVPGTVVALLGPDGAGKTTLMRLVAGLLHPDTGAVRVFGADTITQAEHVRASIGYMPQRFGLYEDLTVQENLDLYADLQGVGRDDRSDRFEALLAMGGLSPFTARLAGRLSGGMKQKLGLVCTLLRRPRLLLLDEPTVGVDPVSRRELWQIITNARAETGMAVLMSTAYLDEAARCDSFIILHEGEVLAQDEPAAFTQTMSGRVFTAANDSASRREVLQRVETHPGVIDALLLGNTIRVVIEKPETVGEIERLTGPLEPAAPDLEDAFIRLLHARTPEAAPAAASSGQRSVDEDVDREHHAISEVGEQQDIIRVEGVTRMFGTFKAVDAVSFTVERGQVFGLLGANGAGKTTTFRMLCGLLPPSAGRLTVAGLDMRRAPAAARARIGYLSQGFALYRELSVARNLRFFAGAYGLKGARLRDRIGWAIDEFELEPMLSMRTERLPLGYKQRLAFACALMHEPSVLFLDEPTSGVDPLGRRVFWRRIARLAASGVTILVTTHFMEEAEYCDRVVIMVAGNVAAQGSPDEIRDAGVQAGAAGRSMEDAFLAIVSRGERKNGA